MLSKEESIVILKNELNSSLNFRIDSFKNCQIFSTLMKGKGIFLSPHTIARFFDILPSRKTYESSVTLLCNYLGYSSFHDFQLKRCTIHMNPTLDHTQSQLKQAELASALRVDLYSLDETLIHEIHWDFISELPEKEKFQLSLLTFMPIRSSLACSGLLRKLACSDFGRDFFYKTFVDEDDPNNYYSKSLQKNFLTHHCSNEDVLFAKGFLITKKHYTDGSLVRLKEVNQVLALNFPPHGELGFQLEARRLELEMILHSFSKEDRNTSFKNEIFTRLRHFYNARELSVIVFRVSRAIIQSNQLTSLIYNSELNTFYKGILAELDLYLQNPSEQFVQLIYLLSNMALNLESGYQVRQANVIQINVNEHDFLNILTQLVISKFDQEESMIQFKRNPLLKNYTWIEKLYDCIVRIKLDSLLYHTC